MEKNCNKGVCCNVCDCAHNEKGDKCNLESIDVSKGSGDHHFCKSYKCKDNCECGCKDDSNDINDINDSNDSNNINDILR